MLRKSTVFMILVSLLLMSGCKISGTVTDNGDGIKGVEIEISGNQGEMTISTNSSGNYEFNNLLPGNYTITPISDGYDFNPVNTTVQITSEITTADFLATVCIAEGESGPFVPDAPECCEGLVPVDCSSPGAGGECDGCAGAFICTACGDGVCGPGENICRCPEDCE